MRNAYWILLPSLVTGCASTDFAMSDPAGEDASGDIASDTALDVSNPLDSSESARDTLIDSASGRDTMSDGGIVETSPPVDATPLLCPTKGGSMMRVGPVERSFCIDATEVTQAAYGQFLLDKAGSTEGQGPKCMWNDSFTVPASCAFDPITTPECQ